LQQQAEIIDDFYAPRPDDDDDKEFASWTQRKFALLAKTASGSTSSQLSFGLLIEIANLAPVARNKMNFVLVRLRSIIAYDKLAVIFYAFYIKNWRGKIRKNANYFYRLQNRSVLEMVAGIFRRWHVETGV